ncbi:hypothetical protein JOQ06_028776, partial [Pogonophryne albipinna]
CGLHARYHTCGPADIHPAVRITRGLYRGAFCQIPPHFQPHRRSAVQFRRERCTTGSGIGPLQCCGS